ncbi:Dgk [Bugula neritina]|uniref:Diacylglycerol kinase n=1 Tax=Bugula neritina TaxID=10212 RepID=A0A7J7JXB4_BUGNE|nr:Dgk [Bugula neritina]
MSAASSSLHILPPPSAIPLVVFINPKSGGKQGMRLLKKFQYLLNPRQVFNMLKDGGPSVALKQFQDIDCRVMVCGGDGTVGWLLDTMDKLDLPRRPPVVVLPLGTGNDMARCLRWGGGYEGESIIKILKRVSLGHTVMLDRWHIQFSNSGDGEEEKGDPIPCNIFNNYFSIGVDAQVAHQFHMMRQKHPEKFNSRVRNKLWYLEFWSAETISATCKNLHENIDVMCDGVALNLANGPSLEGICLLNIPSAHAGSNLWGENSQTRRLSKSRDGELSDINGPSTGDLTTAFQDIGDGLIEVVGMEKCIHLGAVKTGLRSNCRRLAQCASVVIRSRKRLPMQIDGEPWMQPPCTVAVTHKNQVPMVMGPQPRAGGISCFNFV